MSASITLLGLGPGDIRDLTIEAFDLLAQAAAEGRTVYFRTTVHPMVKSLQQRLPQLQIQSFDSYYEESNDWSSLYQQIAHQICTLAHNTPLIYAVPGHPLIGESSIQLILKEAETLGLSTTIVNGLSFLEPVCSLLSLDPFTAGLQILDATELASLTGDALGGKLIPTTPLLVTQVYNRRLASSVKIALSEYYPDEWPITLVRAAGVPKDEAALTMPLYELDRNAFANHLSTLYAPPLDELTALRHPETLRYIITRLRRDPDGCPWDRKQTHQTLTRYVLEEAYEVVDTIEQNEIEKLPDELGDLLLQVYLHAEIARQDETFSIGDVFEQVNAKMMRRHPHIFGSVNAETSEQVLTNWEAIKQAERAENKEAEKQESVFDGLAQALPSLVLAQKYQERAARTGFEFRTREEVIAKIEEEVNELTNAQDQEAIKEELGDLLFMLAKLATFFKIDPEETLRLANQKFRRRFQNMENQILTAGRTFQDYTTEEWLQLWQEAKKQTAK